MKPIHLLLILCIASTTPAEQPTVAELQTALEEDPENRLTLYNLGLLNYLEDNYHDSIIHWSKLKELEPNDWRIRTKLVQAYSAIGEKNKREAEIEALKKLRNGNVNAELIESTFFIRDQFDVNQIHVFVLDYYEMDANWRMGPIKWKFYLTQADEPLDRFLSIGTYDMTTEIARAAGEIGPDDRIFHLDEYENRGDHKTHGMFRSLPDYDLIKEAVIAILNGDSSPISSTQVQRLQPETETTATAP